MYVEEPELGMQYNTQRGGMQIPEYGRNVQKMVAYCLTVEDKEHRNEVAHSIIDVIGNLNPHLRDVPDYRHKLWDHLFIMSGFKLDVESPYPIPTEETFESKPELLEYPTRNLRFRYYGKVAIGMLVKVAEMEDNDERTAIITAIANQMKKNYLAWNKDTVQDSLILSDIGKITDGKINAEGITLAHVAVPKKNKPPQHNNRGKSNNNRRKHYKK
jgi:hypothetical protein